jgi:hypothetical protein
MRGGFLGRRDAVRIIVGGATGVLAGLYIDTSPGIRAFTAIILAVSAFRIGDILCMLRVYDPQMRQEQLQPASGL